MSSLYYLPGPQRSERVRQLFGRIASRYDLINDIQSLGLHRLWKAKLIDCAHVSSDESALDVCCGTGDIALRVAQFARRVIACDFSPEMLARGRERGAAEIFWVQADALDLPFQNESFHVVTIGYGLRNLSDFHRGIGELLRVLKPGGRLLILDFGKPGNILWRTVYFGYLRVIVPLFGLILCGDSAAYRYILESLRAYPAQKGIKELLEQAGCEVRVVNFVGGAMSLHHAIKAASLRERHDVPLQARDLVR